MSEREPFEPVEFRSKVSAPTAPGWYYGRQTHLPNQQIQPVKVIDIGGNELMVLRPGDDYRFRLAGYDWFGATHEVREG